MPQCAGIQVRIAKVVFDGVPSVCTAVAESTSIPSEIIDTLTRMHAAVTQSITTRLSIYGTCADPC
jgi:hypothetical protein